MTKGNELTRPFAGAQFAKGGTFFALFCFPNNHSTRPNSRSTLIFGDSLQNT